MKSLLPLKTSFNKPFHEIKHVLQQKQKTVFADTDVHDMAQIDSELEYEADNFAQNYLIPQKLYNKLAPASYISDEEIIRFANEISIHPGVIAGRLQHDGVIAPNRCSKLRERYMIIFE